MAGHPHRPGQPVDALPGAADTFTGGTEDLLSHLHSVAVSNQPADVDPEPIMVPVAFAVPLCRPAPADDLLRPEDRV